MPMIGGPGSILPRPVESFLSWTLCLSCLSVSGYHYCVSTYFSPFLSHSRNAVVTFLHNLKSVKSASKERQERLVLKCGIPLTTHSRSELDRCTPLQRYHQLLSMLHHIHPHDTTILDNDDKLIEVLTTNHICRRLASLVMRPFSPSNHHQCDSNASSHLNTLSELPLVQRIARLWPQLLKLPPYSHSNPTKFKYHISLILPLYSETASYLRQKLKRALELCENPQSVEIIIVDAGECTHDPIKLVDQLKADSFQQLPSNTNTVAATVKTNKKTRTRTKSWGQVIYTRFTRGGGRGPCMNFGAASATGQIFTFCHADTTLPPRWDTNILHTLTNTTTTLKGGNHLNHFTTNTSKRASACAFSFGIDTSPIGLGASISNTATNDKLVPPPGLNAVQFTANLRTHMYSLPYGDQAISLTSQIFHFLGGFPDQCLMEDYELVALLRKRASVVSKAITGVNHEESLAIIGGEPALCSPRRWQKFGVLYVTFMNSKFVNLYTGGMHPNDLYRLYYGKFPPKRKNDLSPWEIEMEKILASTLSSKQ